MHAGSDRIPELSASFFVCNKEPEKADEVSVHPFWGKDTGSHCKSGKSSHHPTASPAVGPFRSDLLSFRVLLLFFEGVGFVSNLVDPFLDDFKHEANGPGLFSPVVEVLVWWGFLFSARIPLINKRGAKQIGG